MTRKAGNLKLFERLARADDGDTKSSNDRWHKLEPERGATSVMHLCPREAAKMKALFPYIRDSFIETSARQSGRCAMHAESSRLETFLQMLQEADGKAEYSSKPRLEKLLDYHEKMSRVAECPGDALVSDVRWHYAPSCPQLTVCRDCFVNMVYPKIKDRSRVAERIKPTDAYVESEQYIGTACQLWSPRMKRVFASAVKNDDFEYLAKRVEERVMAQQRTSKMIDGFQHEKAQLLRKQASDGRAGATKKDLADREADIEALKDDFEYRLQ